MKRITIEITPTRSDVLHFGAFGWQADHLIDNGCIFPSLEDARKSIPLASASIPSAASGVTEIRIVEFDPDTEEVETLETIDLGATK